jgi:hypothetical protein
VSRLLAILRLIAGSKKPAAAPTEQAKPAPSAPAADPVQAGAEQVRQAAKWLLAALGAVATVLVAGLQFASIGSVPSGWRTAAAIGGAATAIVGVVVLIGLVFQVLRPSTTSITDLAAGKAPRRVRKFVARNEWLLQGWPSAQALATDYQDALKASRQAMDAYQAEMKRLKTTKAPALGPFEGEAEATGARRAYIDRQIGFITKQLALEQLRGRLSVGRQLVAFVAALAIGAGIGAYAWGTNAPKAANGAGQAPELRGATLTGVDLSRVSLAGADLAGASLAGSKLTGADLTGADLTGVDLTNATLRGAKLGGAKLNKVTWKNTICPDGTNSDRGKACKGHL